MDKSLDDDTTRSNEGEGRSQLTLCLSLKEVTPLCEEREEEEVVYMCREVGAARVTGVCVTVSRVERLIFVVFESLIAKRWLCVRNPNFLSFFW